MDEKVVQLEERIRQLEIRLARIIGAVATAILLGIAWFGVESWYLIPSRVDEHLNEKGASAIVDTINKYRDIIAVVEELKTNNVEISPGGIIKATSIELTSGDGARKTHISHDGLRCTVEGGPYVNVLTTDGTAGLTAALPNSGPAVSVSAVAKGENVAGLILSNPQSGNRVGRFLLLSNGEIDRFGLTKPIQ